MKVAILDYGVGNLFSVKRAVEKVGGKADITANPKIFDEVTHLIIPGVGAFPSAMNRLTNLDLVKPIIEFANSGKPVLGLCLGMQLLFEQSTEFTTTKGLGLIPGRVRSFRENPKFKSEIKTPHIGWNNLNLPNSNSTWKETILRYVQPEESVYFVHSFYVEVSREENLLALTEFGEIRFCSAVEQDNVVGLQFHPEKSGTTGLSIIRGFLET